MCSPVPDTEDSISVKHYFVWRENTRGYMHTARCQMVDYVIDAFQTFTDGPPPRDRSPDYDSSRWISCLSWVDIGQNSSAVQAGLDVLLGLSLPDHPNLNLDPIIEPILPIDLAPAHIFSASPVTLATPVHLSGIGLRPNSAGRDWGTEIEIKY